LISLKINWFPDKKPAEENEILKQNINSLTDSVIKLHGATKASSLLLTVALLIGDTTAFQKNEELNARFNAFKIFLKKTKWYCTDNAATLTLLKKKFLNQGTGSPAWKSSSKGKQKWQRGVTKINGYHSLCCKNKFQN